MIYKREISYLANRLRSILFKFWLAEHHNMLRIGSVATSALIGHDVG